MKSLLDKTVFSVADQAFCWEDVVLAATLSGAWADLEARVRRGVSCLARSRQAGETPDGQALKAAAQAFRYERDLISGDEAKAWFARWGLSVERWREYLEWSLLRERSSAPSTDAADATSEQVLCEAVCSGELERLARMLAGRVAVADRAAHEMTEEGAVSDDAPREKAGALALVEQRYAEFLPRLVTPKAVAEQIRLNLLDWIRFDCEIVAFSSEGMAREAALGVREDGMTLAEVAAEVGRPVERRRSGDSIDGVDPSVKTALLAASPGELVGPVLVDGDYYLLLVLEKIVPSTDDPETVERAERAALDAALTREINDRVRWHWRL